jgi:hypothetical protein
VNSKVSPETIAMKATKSPYAKKHRDGQQCRFATLLLRSKFRASDVSSNYCAIDAYLLYLTVMHHVNYTSTLAIYKVELYLNRAARISTSTR